MAATVTLSTTTLASPVSASSSEVKVASTTGLSTGTRLFVDKELMSVEGFGVSNSVKVIRGVDGTAASAHSSSATVTIGRADQFYDTDPVGTPDAAIPVSPYINVRNGKIWVAQGSEVAGGDVTRWWQEQTTTYSTGALGVQIATTTP
jgi:hypothetical protein